MTRVTQHKARQVIVVTGSTLEDGLHIEELALFDINGDPVSVNGLARRDTIDHTTASLDPNDTEDSLLVVSPAWRPFKVVTNRPARIRIYPTEDYRTADATRPKTLDPPLSSDHGLLFELITTATQLSYHLTPAVDMASETNTSSDFYLAVTNLDEVAGSVITTYSFIRTE